MKTYNYDPQPVVKPNEPLTIPRPDVEPDEHQREDLPEEWGFPDPGIELAPKAIFIKFLSPVN